MCVSGSAQQPNRGLPWLGAMMSGDPQRMQNFRSQFQAAHGGMTAQQLVQQRNATGGQPSTTGG